eukprot:353632-Chlamydomonas_euryale.AAC.3
MRQGSVPGGLRLVACSQRPLPRGRRLVAGALWTVHAVADAHAWRQELVPPRPPPQLPPAARRAAAAAARRPRGRIAHMRLHGTHAAASHTCSS